MITDRDFRDAEDSDDLKLFLFVLLRDHIPAGVAYSIIEDHVEKAHGKTGSYEECALTDLAEEIRDLLLPALKLPSEAQRRETEAARSLAEQTRQWIRLMEGGEMAEVPDTVWLAFQHYEREVRSALAD